ncbi:MAG: flagellar hook-basal body complex protein FliE [Pirellulales bacterium]
MQIPKDSLFNTHPFVVASQRETELKSQTLGFVDLLRQGLQGVNDMQQESQSQIEDLLTGKDVNSAEVMTSMQKADMSFRLLVQVRNKLMKAYEELNAMRV